jgi:hypothetical protein
LLLSSSKPEESLAALVTRLGIPLLVVGVAWCIASRQNSSYAKELTQPTVQAFAHYVQLTEARIQNAVSDPRQFLYSYTLPEKARNAVQALPVRGPRDYRAHGHSRKWTDGPYPRRHGASRASNRIHPWSDSRSGDSRCAELCPPRKIVRTGSATRGNSVAGGPTL